MAKIRIVRREGYWAVKRDDREDTLSRHGSQKEAVDAGRDLGKREQIEFSVETENGAPEVEGP